ncbi:hypothetical protein [Bacillus methanolicus]|nr:hypothetical protein [Bacillus methanolicus]
MKRSAAKRQLDVTADSEAPMLPGGSVQTTCRNVGKNEKTTTHSK